MLISLCQNRKKKDGLKISLVRSLVFVTNGIKERTSIPCPCHVNNTFNSKFRISKSTSEILYLKHESFTTRNINRVGKIVMIRRNSACTDMNIPCNIIYINQWNPTVMRFHADCSISNIWLTHTHTQKERQWQCLNIYQIVHQIRNFPYFSASSLKSRRTSSCVDLSIAWCRKVFHQPVSNLRHSIGYSFPSGMYW